MLSNDVFEFQGSPARSIFFAGMMLLLDKRFVLRKLGKKLSGKIGYAVKEVYPYREICPKDKRSAAVPDNLLDLFSLAVPAGRAFDKRNARRDARRDIPPHCPGRRKIYRDIRAS